MRTKWVVVLVVTVAALALGLGLFLGSRSPKQQGDSRDATPGPETNRVPTDPLALLNKRSREAYKQARERTLSTVGPIIFVDGDDLILRRDDKRIQHTTIPAEYHALKTIAHIPLAVHAILVHHTRDQIPAATREDLTGYRSAIVSATDTITSGPFPSPESRTRQKQIIEKSLTFIDATLRDGKCTHETLKEYCQDLRPAIYANVGEAAQAQITALHSQVMTWRKELPAAEWDRVVVIVFGSQLPRKDNAAVQYFAHIFGTEGESDRLIYAEGLPDETAALKLLSVRLHDRKVGEDMFDDPKRMFRDLLGDAARIEVGKLPRD